MQDASDGEPAARAEPELCAEYLLGFRRGLQRSFHGASVVSDAEHAAWLSLEREGERWQRRLAGYLDGVATAGDAGD